VQNAVLADYDHPAVIGKAMELTVGATCDRDKIHCIFLYVRDGIRFGFPANGDLVKALDRPQTSKPMGFASLYPSYGNSYAVRSKRALLGNTYQHIHPLSMRPPQLRQRSLTLVFMQP
jgi:hypothetical protein